MKIVKSSGCTAFYTEVDGKELGDLTEEEQAKLLERLLKIHNLHGMSHTINLLLDHMDYDSEKGGQCDQCGDTVHRQIYDLDEYKID